MKKKKKSQQKFSIYSEPHFYIGYEPQQEIIDQQLTCIAETEYSKDIELNGIKYQLNLEGDQEDGYRATLSTVKETRTLNPNYEKELAVFLKKKELMKKWRAWKKEELKKIEKQKEDNERALFKKLKEKYETQVMAGRSALE